VESRNALNYEKEQDDRTEEVQYILHPMMKSEERRSQYIHACRTGFTVR